MEQVIVGGDILHRSAVMCKADAPLPVDDTVQRHPPELEQIDLLAVHLRDLVIRVGQADERNALVRPILFECRR